MSFWNSKEQPYETISRGQAHTYKGNLFSSTHLFTGVADGSSVEMVGQTNSVEVWAMFMVKATGEAEIEFEQGTTFTDIGTEVLQRNRNGMSSKTAVGTIYHTPTVDTAGDILAYDLIPGGSSQPTRMGGEAGTGAHYITPPNTNDLFRAINTSGSITKILFEIMWYERE